MAFVGDDKKLLDPNQAQQAQGTAQQTDPNQTQNAPSGGGDVVSGSTPASSDPSSQATAGQQSGTGGVGGWTNIQAYMNANKGDTGAATNLQNTVGGQFDQDKQAVTDQASQAKSQAQGQANQEGTADSSAADWLKNAGSQYSWGGTQSKGYQDQTGQLKDALNAQYTAPTSYNFGLSDKSQNYGQTLGNDQAFSQFLGDQYQKQAGAPLSTGDRNLQTQLDASNEALGTTRQNLLSQYAGLGNYRDQQVADANSAAQQSQQDFTNHKANLQNTISNRATTDLNDLSNAQTAAKSAYQNEFNSGSGRATGGFDVYNNMRSNGSLPSQSIAGGQIDNRANQGVWGDNLTYNQLQNEANLYNPQNGWVPGSPVGDQIAGNNSALQNWYGSEDQKYANTGDAQKQEWNAIQDILGSNAARQTQGFKVRG